MELEIQNVATGWREVVALFATDRPTRIATRHGMSFDIPGLTMWLRHPTDLTPPSDYPFPELINDYRNRIFGDQRQKSLLYQRLRSWRSTPRARVDQVDRIVELLREDPHSRAAAFSVWQPGEDLGNPYPVSPVGGAFRVIDGAVTLFLTARSLDVWVGLVPELLTFAQLTSDVTVRLGLASSQICYHAWSAHLYEIDYLTYLGDDG